MVKDLVKAAQWVEDFVINTRRKLHEIPELRWEETKTTKLIMATIHEIMSQDERKKDLFVNLHEMKGGIIINLGNDPDKKRILFRADYDGLPIEEATGLHFSSKHPGKMHACGHDIHTAMLLGFFKLAVCGLVDLKHNLRLVFQRAEENPVTESGGASLVKEGVLEGVDEAYALHIAAMEENGTFFSRPGVMLANSDRIKISVSCSGGHVAFPEVGSNAVDIGMDICNMMTGLGTRLLGPGEPLSLVPAAFNAGSANGSNVRPASVELWFAARNFLNKEKREAFHVDVKHAVKKVVERYEDAKVTVTSIKGHPSLANDEANYETVIALLEEAGEKTKSMKPMFGGEDFAWYLKYQGGVPGAMFMLGAHQSGTGDHHTPNFNPDEAVFYKGVLFWSLLATK